MRGKPFLPSVFLLLALPCFAQAASPPRHPFLLLTPADIERAQRAAGHDPALRTLAQELIRRAATERTEDLPPLEREWWEAARQKPWRDTYPQIFHHTFSVPMKWADLARACARASLLAPAPELAGKAKRLLLALADYTFEFEHYDVGMNYTIWAMAALDAYDILYDRFEAAERAKMDAFFQRFLAAVVKNDEYWIEHEPGGKLNNHYAWHKLGRGMIGLFHQRPELVEEALHGPKGVDFMLRHGFKDNGLWLEGSIPYQFAATAALLQFAVMLENARYPASLFGSSTPDGHSLKQSYDALLPLLFPDRTLPAIGDCYGRRPHLAEHSDWETLYRQFREPVYAWLLRDHRRRAPQALFDGVPDLPPAPPPPQVSGLWPEMGYVALRSLEGTNYWSGRGWSLFATYSSRPVHDNADKLSFLLFADGHLWLPDSEAKPAAEHAFSSSVQARLNRETLCHNTLLVDGRSQRFPGKPLDLVEYENLPQVKRVTLGDLAGQLYPGVRQLRTLLVRDDYVLDFFQVQSSEPHEFAWLTHVDGAPAGGSLSEWDTTTLPAGAPWSYLRNAKRAKNSATSAWECFKHDQRLLRLDLAADGPMETLRCEFPLDDSPAPPTIPVRLCRRRGTEAWFAAVYRRVASPEEPLELKVRPGELQTWQVEITRAGTVARHVVPALSPKP